MTQEELDKLIALGVDFTVLGKCPWCTVPCNNPWCGWCK